MRRILVTGGAGFMVYPYMRELDKKGYDVIVIDSLINSSLIALKRVSKIVNLKDDVDKKFVCKL